MVRSKEKGLASPLLKAGASKLLQLRVLCLSVFQDRDIGVGIFPKGQKILIGGAGFGAMVLLGVGASQLQLGQAHQRISAVGASQVQNGLKLMSGLSGLVVQQIGATAGEVDVARTLVIRFAGFHNLNGFGGLAVVHRENGLYNRDEHGLKRGIQRPTAAHIFHQTSGLGFTTGNGRNFSR
jgi:hypothetical protein